jgi:hypothetical protein
VTCRMSIRDPAGLHTTFGRIAPVSHERAVNCRIVAYRSLNR